MTKLLESQSIADALGVEPIQQPVVERPVQQVQEIVVPHDDMTDSIEEDFKLARESIRDAIKTGTRALEDLVAVANASEHPRAYEVLSSTISTITNSAEKLLEINKKKRELSPISNDASGPQTINNTLVMTSAEMLEFLKTKLADES